MRKTFYKNLKFNHSFNTSETYKGLQKKKRLKLSKFVNL